MTETNIELARRGYDAMARGDYETVRDLLDPSVKWHGGNPRDGCQNRAETLAFMQRPNRPARLPKVEEFIDAGDRVVAIMRGESPEGPTRHANLTTFRDGKVVEMVHYDDPADALTAAGVQL